MVIELALYPLHSQLRISDNGGTISGHQVKKQLSQVLTATLYLLPGASYWAVCVNHGSRERGGYSSSCYLTLRFSSVDIALVFTPVVPVWQPSYLTDRAVLVSYSKNRLLHWRSFSVSLLSLAYFYLWPTEGFGLFLMITFTWSHLIF